MERANTGLLSGDRRVLPVVLLGILLVIVPFLLVPSPGDGGPITFGVRLVQTIVAFVGFGVVGTGLYSLRTGNLRPAITAATTVVGLFLVAVVGGVIEMTGGPLVPVWAWLLAAVLVVGVSLTVSERLVDDGR